MMRRMMVGLMLVFLGGFLGAQALSNSPVVLSDARKTVIPGTSGARTPESENVDSGQAGMTRGQDSGQAGTSVAGMTRGQDSGQAGMTRGQDSGQAGMTRDQAGVTSVEPTPTPEPTPPPDPYLGEPAASAATYRIPILMYHYVGANPDPDDTNRNKLSVTPDQFKAQMHYLITEGYTVLTLDMVDDILKGEQTPPEKAVVLTFDDAYIDFYYNAYPILVEVGLPATVFVPTGLIGTESYMTWGMIEELVRISSVDFQSHGVSHAYLPSLSRDRIRAELVESRERLAEVTGRDVTWLAYPYGALSGTVTEIAKEVGYVGAVGTWSGVMQSETYRYNLPRQRIAGAMGIEDFAARL